MPHVVAIRSGTSAVRAMWIALVATVAILGAIALVVSAWPEASDNTATAPMPTAPELQSATAAEHRLLTRAGSNIQSTTAAEHGLSSQATVDSSAAPEGVGQPSAPAVVATGEVAGTPRPVTAAAAPAAGGDAGSSTEQNRTWGTEPVRALDDAAVATAQFLAGERITAAPIGTKFTVNGQTFVVDHDRYPSEVSGR